MRVGRCKIGTTMQNRHYSDTKPALRRWRSPIRCSQITHSSFRGCLTRVRICLEEYRVNSAFGDAALITQPAVL